MAEVTKSTKTTKKVLNKSIVKRFDDVMESIGCEHLMLDNEWYGEVEQHKDWYEVKRGVLLCWMLNEAEYWLSCYYEAGHCRCDDRFESKDAYKVWVSETGKLKRLIARLKKEIEKNGNTMVIEW